MSKGNTFENDFLKLVFNATPIANIADNAVTAPLTVFYLALHTADPGEAGAQNTTECAYAGYARVAVNRTGAAWVVTANSVSPAATVAFPASTTGPETATHASVGTAISGVGKILYKGAIAPTIAIANGVTPQLGVGSAITED